MEILFGESSIFHVNLGTRMYEDRWRCFNNDLKIKSLHLLFFSHAERWCFINEPQNAQRRLIIFSCISAEKMKYNTPLHHPPPPSFINGKETIIRMGNISARLPSWLMSQFIWEEWDEQAAMSSHQPTDQILTMIFTETFLVWKQDTN